MVTRMNLPTTFETVTFASARLSAKDEFKYTPRFATLAAAIFSDRVPTLLRPRLGRLDIKACSADAKGAATRQPILDPKGMRIPEGCNGALRWSPDGAAPPDRSGWQHGGGDRRGEMLVQYPLLTGGALSGGDTPTAKATENAETEQWELGNGFSLVV